MVLLFVPVVGNWYWMRRTRTADDRLVALRQAFVSLSWAFVAFGVVVLAANPRGEAPGTTFPIVVVIAGIASVLGGMLLRRPLDCSTDHSLANSYRTQFFMRLALALTVAMIGFVGVFVTGAAWLYFLAMVFTAIGLIRLAPTRANLQSAHSELSHSGCERSLVSALRTVRPRR